ncbi:MAG: T9SS type B sorting domain-containing protein, partial [Cruoricaptor ignavus]|nr:T9SS type B sorting domain-containing protein [Cruoricaptor ignavus]
FSLINLFFSQTNQVIKHTDGNLVKDVVYYCAGENYRLQTDDYKSDGSSSYVSEDVSIYNSIINTSVGEINVPFSALHRNSVFSQAINLGFNFEFFGKTYSKVVVGTNGRIVMSDSPELDNLHNSAEYTDRLFNRDPNYAQLPSTKYNQVYVNPENRELPLAQIFAGFTNLRSQNSITFYKYKPVTFEGKRGMLFTFQEVVPHNGTGGNYGGRFTSRVIIFEDGKVVVNVQNKISVTYNAILGMQNEDATEFLVPNHSDTRYNYNNGYWSSESATAFVFTTGVTRTPTYEWTRNGVVQSSTDRFYNFSPTENTEEISVKVTFAEDTDGSLTKSGLVLFKKIQKPNITATYGNCGEPVNLTITNFDDHPSLVYEWFSAAEPNVVLATGKNYLATQTGTYFVKIKTNETSSYCETSESISVTVESAIPVFSFDENKVFSYCDQNASGSKTVNLLSEIGYSTGTNYSVRFLENGVEITDYTNFIINSGETLNLKIVVETNVGVVPSCKSERNFILKYLAFPTSSTIYESDKLCLGTPDYTVADFKNKYPQFSDYHILFSTNGVDFDRVEVNPSFQSSVWIKVSHPDFSCGFNYQFNFQFYAEVIANQSTTVFPAKCETDARFDFSILKSEINPSSSVEITFHRSWEDAQSGQNPIQSSDVFPVGNSTVYIRVKDVVKQCVALNFPTFEVNVFAKPQLSRNVINLEKCQGETFDLTQNISDLLASINPEINYEIKYFAPNGNQLSGTQITQYQPSDFGVNGLRPYLEIHYNNSCSDKVDYQLVYNVLPQSLINEISVCDEVSFSLNEFKNQVIANPSDYIFTDENGVVLSQDFALTTLPKTVKFYLENKSTGCKSQLQEITFKRLNDAVLDQTELDFTLCDITENLFDGKTVFNLSSKNQEITSNASASFRYYKDANFNQEITNPETYTNESSTEIIYVKVSISGFCPSVAKINLKVNIPTKSTTLQDKYFICYGTSVSINAGSENASFSWSDGQNGQTATFSQAGNYSVTLTNSDGCSYTHQFIISDENQPKIDKINQDETKIEVLATGNYPIEYSFNGSAFTSSNILLNPTDEEYEIRVRSVIDADNGIYCLGEPAYIFTIKVPNAITPNGDGINDVWQVKNLDKMEQVELVILDRFGRKLFASTDKDNLVWNGKSNGRELPTATYWYIVKWYDPARKTNEIQQGWVLLKNRN